MSSDAAKTPRCTAEGGCATSQSPNPKPPRVAIVTPASLRTHSGDSLRPLAQARGLWAAGFRKFTVFTSDPDPNLPFHQEKISVRGPLRFVFDQPHGYDLIHAQQTAGLFLKGRVWADLHGYAPLESGLNWREHPLSPRAAVFYFFSRVAARRLSRKCERWIAAAESIAENARRAVGRLPPVSVVHNCLDPAEYPVAPCADAVVGVVGPFTGRWARTMFAMALRTAAACPEARFRFVGRLAPDQRAVAAGMKNIELLGEVGDAEYRGFFRGISIALLPFEPWCRGGGARQKLLQAAASGIALAATPAGAEGFNFSDEILIGESPAELAAQIRRLMDREERQNRGLALRRIVERDYNLEIEGRRLAELYMEGTDSWQKRC